MIKKVRQDECRNEQKATTAFVMALSGKP
jgi:hypothetical protein